MLTHTFWRERFASDPSVIGRSVSVEGRPVTIVGVLRPDFRWPGVEATPIAGYGLPEMLLTIIPPGDTATRRNATWIGVLARLARAASRSPGPERPRCLRGAAAHRLPRRSAARRNPGRPAQGRAGRLGPAGAPRALGRGGAPARAHLRQRGQPPARPGRVDGSTRWRCARRSGRPAETWSGSCSARASCSAWPVRSSGGCLARAALPALTAAIPPAQRAALPFLQRSPARLGGPRLLDRARGADRGPVRRRPRAAALAAPSWPPTIKEGGVGSATPGRHRAMQLLVLLQVALAVVLLNGAGLFARSLSSVLSVDPGFRPGGVVVGTLALPRRAPPGPRVRRRWTGSSPPLSRAALGQRRRPDQPPSGHHRLRPDGRARSGGTEPSTFATARSVSDRYFETLGVPLLRGRCSAPTTARRRRRWPW